MQPPRGRHRQHQPGDRGDAERRERGPLHRDWLGQPAGDEPHRADAHVVGAAHAVAVVVGVVDADLQARLTTSAGPTRHHTGDGPPTAAPAPTATGTTAAGSVRGRAPRIHRFTAVTVAF